MLSQDLVGGLREIARLFLEDLSLLLNRFVQTVELRRSANAGSESRVLASVVG